METIISVCFAEISLLDVSSEIVMDFEDTYSFPLDLPVLTADLTACSEIFQGQLEEDSPGTAVLFFPALFSLN